MDFKKFDKVKIVSTIITIAGFVTTIASDWVADKQLDSKITEITKRVADEMAQK